MELDETTIETFRSETRQYAQIDKLIEETKKLMKPLQDRLKQLKLEKQELEKEICDVMQTNDLKIVELPNNTGTIEYQVKKAMIPITQKTLKEKMILFFEEGPGSELAFNSKNYKTKGESIYEYIYGKDNRDFITREKLKSKDIKI